MHQGFAPHIGGDVEQDGGCLLIFKGLRFAHQNAATPLRSQGEALDLIGFKA